MAVISVYQRPETVFYKSSVCSKASLVVLVLFVTTVVTPLIIVYRSQGLWIKEAEYREQPNVLFKHQMLLVVETSDGPLVWSSSSIYNSHMKNYLRTPLIKSSETDDNYDGWKDKLQFSLTLPLLANEFVYGASLLITFDYRLQHICHVILEGTGLLQHSSGTPISALYHHADLVLHQRHPLPYARTHSLYDISVFPNSDDSPVKWALSNILNDYWKRNITTRFSNTYTSWQSGSGDTFTLKLEVRYPEQTVRYIPGFWYVLKWAWVQYFSLLAVILFFTNLVKDWVFQNFIVSTWMDVPKKKLT
ncbi:hypothetical protein SK128_019979 [Halocaridina rubra]|uniref:Transmembrane protein 231 n=1 Tax=Halocaridina rubra TaxID=373956 RepID=A0AAN8WSP3_HALRR